MEIFETHKDLIAFLDDYENIRVEVETSFYGSFTGVSCYIEEDCGENYDEFGWFFSDVEGVNYNAICLKDIARVRLVGETTWAWDISQTAPQKYLQAV